MRIVFFGTPEFAVSGLEALHAAGHEICAVVTAPDKPAGRGMQLRGSAVKEAAIRLNLPVLQPRHLRDEAFLEELLSYNADLFVIVAFRMLPEAVWNMPPLGSWNLHASLLPQYRGAAPINHAIINGESITGLTTFKLSHEIDTGAIGLQQSMEIGPNETAGELHDRMKVAGAELLVRTMQLLTEGKLELIPQEKMINGPLKEAPKLNSEFCRINPGKPAREVHNHIRGLSPFPGAYTFIQISGQEFQLKLLSTRLTNVQVEGAAGTWYRQKEKLYIMCGDGLLEVLELQQQGKKRMPADAFLRGSRAFSEQLVEL